MEIVTERIEHIIVSELDRERIAALRANGFCVVRISPNHFGSDSCIVDGFVMVRRS